MMYDLIITNALIVDGTGAAARPGSVAVSGSRIVAVGEVTGEASRTIDAGGHVVAPGFIDVHTHLDAQVIWDPMMSVSSWHGVTTVVTGNCGFGIAPTKAEDRVVALRTLENVEGMDFDSLTAGLGDWGFETFPEYMDKVAASLPALNIATLVPHSALRLYVMGADASTRAATADEIAQMGEHLRAALRAGAAGLSSSMTPGHAGSGGIPVPSRLAGFPEFLGLLQVMAEEGTGLFMAALGPGLSFRQLRELADQTGRPITFASILTDMGGPGGHHRLVKTAMDLIDEGYEIIPQVTHMPVSMEFSLATPFPLTNSAPGTVVARTLEEEFTPIYNEPTIEGRIRLYSEPDFRERFRAGTNDERWESLIWTRVTILEVPGRPELELRSLLEYAAENGLHPSEAVYDLSMETGLEAKFVLDFLNNDKAEVAKLIKLPKVQLGLSDAGAHVSQLCDAWFGSALLSEWVRDRKVLTLENAVEMLTSRAARLFRIRDRGVIAEGNFADLVVFDPDTIGAGPRSRRRDLPAAAPRVVVEAVGVDYVIVNGQLMREHNSDVPREVSSGRVLRAADFDSAKVDAA
jgi:N-acyl-D-amino-acid deacylase